MINQNFSIVGKITGQRTPDSSLPISQQFQLGGNNNLSYESSEFSGDEGQAIELELQYDLSWENSLRPFLSNADFKLYSSLQWGDISSSDSQNYLSAETLALGLHSRLSSWANLKITMATPLTNKHSKTNKRHFLLSFQSYF